MTARKLCETVGVDWQFIEYDRLERTEKRAWLNLFVEALADYVKSDAE